MNWWWLYPIIGLAIGLGLDWVDAINLDDRWQLLLLVWLWPLALPLLIWHGISTLRWNRMSKRRSDQPSRNP
jgi:hypothetical protein